MNEKIKSMRVIGTALILIVIAFTTTIESRSMEFQENTMIKLPNGDKEDKIIEVIVTEHLIDKSFYQKTHKMYLSEFEILQTQLLTALSLEEKFEVLKKYQILDVDASDKKYENIIKEKIRAYNLHDDSKNKIKPVQINRDIQLLQNFLCGVLLITEGLNIPIGFSIITAYINEELFNKYQLLIPSVDLLDLCIGYTNFRTNGPLGKSRFGGEKTFSGLMGFAGISLREKESVITSRMGVYLGFSLYAYSLIFAN